MSRILAIFSSPKAVPAPFVTLSTSVGIGEVFRQQLLVGIQANFPALRPTLEKDEIHIEPVGFVLKTNIFSQNQHPDVLMCTLGVQLFHPVYFPVPIAECLVGYGTDELTAITSGAQAYLAGVFATVIEAVQGSRDPALDIAISADNVWHPIIGGLQVQGAWTGQTEGLVHEYLFELLKPLLLKYLELGPFHWLKLYASRQPNGRFIGDCLFDNQPLEEGLQKLREEVAHWPYEGQFAGQKQFMLFRKCG